MKPYTKVSDLEPARVALCKPCAYPGCDEGGLPAYGHYFCEPHWKEARAIFRTQEGERTCFITARAEWEKQVAAEWQRGVRAIDRWLTEKGAT